jgi:hypothetical protein
VIIINGHPRQLPTHILHGGYECRLDGVVLFETLHSLTHEIKVHPPLVLWIKEKIGFKG